MTKLNGQEQRNNFAWPYSFTTLLTKIKDDKHPGHNLEIKEVPCDISTVGLGYIEIQYYDYCLQKYCDYCYYCIRVFKWCLVSSTCVL